MALRVKCCAGAEEILAAYGGRLVPIKRVDQVLRAVAEARRHGLPVRLVVAGDGECRQGLEALAARLGVGEAVTFLGYVSDPSTVVAGADLAILASDDEGTPVALIEAAAGAPGGCDGGGGRSRGGRAGRRTARAARGPDRIPP